MNPHVKGLLSLFWRMMAFVPVGILGFAALVVVLGLTVILPMVAVLIDGRYLLGSITVVVWIAWLRYGGRLRRLVLEGFEHGSL